MTRVELPALDGRSPLGFLAALGLLRVLDEAGTSPLQLSFSRNSATAELHSPLASPDEVIEKLQGLVSQDHDAAIVGLDPRFPPRAGRSGGDPLRRLTRPAFRELMEKIRGIDARAASDWMPCLFTDLVTDPQGHAGLTPFCAPSGQQNTRTFFEKSLSEVRKDPSLLSEALIMWRRVNGFTGEYLDHRVLNSAADDAGGKSMERGVPGATWLATMSIPLLRVTGDGGRVRAVLWHRIGRRPIMIWPLWSEPLDPHAVKVMIEHPCLAPVNDRPTVRSDVWSALKIFAVYAAERQHVQGRKSAGVLAPCPVETV